MKEVALLIFQKNPELGKVKTRLAATIGNEKALEIYHQLVDLTLKEAIKTQFEIFIFYSDFIPEQKPSALMSFGLQKGDDLGERMKNAFQEVLKFGYKKALIIGTDCPEIKAELVTEAAQILDGNDLVLGPAEDGGYYLLGMNSLQKEIFEQVAWSTESVLKQTLEKAERKGLKVSLLEMLNDIDTAEDLKKLIDKKPQYESIFRYHG
ncbi:TIGR04282 family arsenosugar biosynthesis glycosyltransferase [Algoriphagus mannitolivorans]|uniref:TIGR04282 family arsenosugar biosynthesis glycosyltransferase n=1 Tax=Algoriphagus mannitolivorans TaxID=226504 RepID=UPI000404805C|nr:TIGR04282 family arsenosugar biosynthesis glycosyltransferase [Algoriphagus mannitolivorans]